MHLGRHIRHVYVTVGSRTAAKERGVPAAAVLLHLAPRAQDSLFPKIHRHDAVLHILSLPDSTHGITCMHM